MRYYIVDNNGVIHGESSDKTKAKLLMHDIFTDEEIVKNEIEIIDGK